MTFEKRMVILTSVLSTLGMVTSLILAVTN